MIQRNKIEIPNGIKKSLSMYQKVSQTGCQIYKILKSAADIKLISWICGDLQIFTQN